MFKLIAIRPLKGCRESALKCLTIGQMYYFCNDYIITDDGIRMRDEYVRPLPGDFFTTKGNNGLQVNISAVVGMNGDGKSTLLELAMRLINNCAKHYRLMDKDSLLRIEGIKAELYYQIDDEVFVIRETEKDDYTNLAKYADLSNHNVRRWEKLMTKVQGVKRMDNLFYTIVSNYSHYAYNTGDFRDEWNENIKWGEDESEQCWLYYLFHKNDGYLAPMTIHPYRHKGNIDINRETDLTMQRLMALYIQEPSPRDNEQSFRRIGEKDAEVLRLTDVGLSKLQEHSIVSYFKDMKPVSALTTIINLIEGSINKDDVIVENLQDNTIDVVEQSLELILDDRDSAYQKYLEDMMIWVGKRKRLFTSRSDLRLFLSALLKFNRNVEGVKLPYDRLVRRFKKYDKLNINQLKRLRMVYEVAKLWAVPVEILTKDYKDLTDIERCQHYIIYKTIDICGTYPKYRDLLDEGDRGWNSKGLVVQTGVIADAVGTMQQDDSHVTLKLRQCLNFIERRGQAKDNVFEQLDQTPKPLKLREDNKGSLLVSFDDLRNYYDEDPFPLELLPPPIYKSDPMYRTSRRGGEWIPYRFLSSGEKQLLQNMGALLYHLRNLDSVKEDGRRYENVNIFLEEIELYFHPDYQRKIVQVLLDKIYAINLKHIKRINIVFVTHSPFILSDIPLCNVLFLKEGNPYMGGMQENSFGANIHGMLKNGFFLPSLPMGEFAHEKINGLFGRLNGYKLDSNNREQAEWFYSNILRVGEPYIREQLMRLYHMHYPFANND